MCFFYWDNLLNALVIDKIKGREKSLLKINIKFKRVN